MSSISIPLDQSDSKITNTKLCQSKVCSDIIQGYDCGEEAADWVSNALEVSFLRLVRQSDEEHRLKKKGDGEQKYLSLSNQAQYLLINKATVRWLSTQINDPQFLDSIEELTDRFRGNIMIETDQELVERIWNRVIIGKHEFKVGIKLSF
jgi:molybdenum cofactor sulfurtransferase